MKSPEETGRIRAAGALVLIAVAACFFWFEFRLRNPYVDSQDTVYYLANGFSLMETRHPFFGVEKFTDFSNHIEIHRLVAYPNQLYALVVSGLSKGVSAIEGRLVVWPVFIINIVSTMAGFGFLFLLFRRFLPPRDVWLGLTMLMVHCLLMTSLTRPLTDAPGWCCALGLLWLAVSRPVSPWALGACVGAALLMRMQLILLLPFLIALRYPQAGFRDFSIGFLKAAGVMAGVVLLFELGMKLYVRLPPGAGGDNVFGNATYYVREQIRFVTDFGSLRAAAVNFGGSLAALVHPYALETIGLFFPLSLVVWAGRDEPGPAAGKQVRLLWGAAVAWSLLPLLLYASENNPVPSPRYQIVSIPLYLLTALYGLNRLPAFSGKRVVVAGVKVSLAAMALAGGLVFALQPDMGKRPYFKNVAEIYEDFENLPAILARHGMPANGVYVVKPDMQAFLPASRRIELPDQSDFSAGARNREVDGIITVARFAKGLNTSEPAIHRWKIRNDTIEDDQGVRFVRVYCGRGNRGLLIYKREP